jgi:elongation factor 1-beta
MSSEFTGGIAGVKMKIMPTSPNVNIKEIETNVKEIVKSEGGINNEYSTEPVAFGLVSLTAFFQWPEEKELEKIEEKIKALENIQSVQLTDIRKIA